MNRDMLSRQLTEKGTDEMAEDGALGLQAIKDLKPDLVLMDIGLYVMNGWEATTAISDDSISHVDHRFNSTRMRRTESRRWKPAPMTLTQNLWI